MGQREQTEIERLRRRVAALASSGGLDHGILAGLTDDDHSQYALASGARGNFETAGAVAAHEAAPDPHAGYTTAAELAAAIAAHTTDLGYTASTRELTSSTGSDVTLPLVSTSDAGLAPASGGGTTNYLRADGSWATPPAGGTGATSYSPGSITVATETALQLGRTAKFTTTQRVTVAGTGRLSLRN